MTTTQPLETLKTTFRLSANKIKHGLNGRVLFGTLAVLAALFAVGFVPRWRANATLASSVRDQRPTVTVISSQKPGDAADLVLPGSTQAIQETALYARTNGYVRKWNVDIGAKVEAGQLLAEIETPGRRLRAGSNWWLKKSSHRRNSTKRNPPLTRARPIFKSRKRT